MDESGALTASVNFPSLAGPTVNEHTALSISAVWNAVNIYANTIAGMDFYIAERGKSGGHRPAFEHPCYDLIHTEPNRITTSFRFRQAIVGHALTYGNGFAELVFDGKYPKELHLLDPRNTVPEVDKDTGELTYRLVREGASLPSYKVLHIAGLGFDGVRGYSPIAVARQTLGLAKAQEQWSSSLMGNSAQPNGFLKSPANMKEEQVARLRDGFNKTHQGSDRAGNVGILFGGLEWVQTSFSPADAELILARGFSIAEVARIFNLPQHKLGLLDHATFSNIEEQNLDFYQTSLVPWLINIEQEFSRKILTPSDRRTYFIRHNPETLLRGNSAAQTARNTAYFGVGAFSVNDILLSLGMNPVDHPNADKHWVPVNNLQALEDIGRPAVEDDPDQETEDPVEVDPHDEQPEKLPPGTFDAIRDVFKEAMNRAIRRENASIVKASKRTGFVDWLDEWLPEHADYLAESLAPALRALSAVQGKAIDPRTFAESLCDGSRDALRGIAARTPAEELPGAIERQAGEWAASRADSILDLLFNKQ